MYKDQLTTAGLFWAQLADRGAVLKALNTPKLGDSLLKPDGTPWMTTLAHSAPKLNWDDLAQIPALPLGSWLKTDPWDDHVHQLNAKLYAPLNPRDKMPLGSDAGLLQAAALRRSSVPGGERGGEAKRCRCCSTAGRGRSASRQHHRQRVERSRQPQPTSPLLHRLRALSRNRRVDLQTRSSRSVSSGSGSDNGNRYPILSLYTDGNYKVALTFAFRCSSLLPGNSRQLEQIGLPGSLTSDLQRVPVVQLHGSTILRQE